MRPVAILLACGCASFSGIVAVEPLPQAGEARTEATHLLIALAGGDTAPLLAAEASLFAAAPAISDPARPGLGLRWSAGIAPALARLPADRRDAALTALDQLATRLLPEHPDLALDLLPAPQARATLAREAARRWDAGDLSAFLELGTALAACGDPVPDWSHRQDIARSLLDPVPVDPGWPLPTAEPIRKASSWEVEPGWLLALDTWQRVRWQRPLPPGARCRTGPDGAVVVDATRVQLIDPTGAVRDLPPLPTGAICLGVAAGAAWFGLGQRTWRVDDGIAEIQLGAEVLGPPLVGRLFLTPQELIRDGRRSRHGLPAGPGWHLAADRSGAPLICAPDGRRWLVPALTGDAAALERVGRFAEADALPGRSQALLWRSALRRGDWTTAATCAATTWEQSVTAWYAGQRPATVASPWPRLPADLALPEDAWDHVLLPGISTPEDDVPVTVRPGDGRLVAERAGRWRHRWLPLPELAAPSRSQARSGDFWLVVEGDQRLLAFDRSTGDIVFDRMVRQAPLYPDRCVLWRRGGAVVGALVLAPPGIDDRLWWIGPAGERMERLPAPARTLGADAEGNLLLELQDGRQLSCDARQDPPEPWR